MMNKAMNYYKQCGIKAGALAAAQRRARWYGGRESDLEQALIETQGAAAEQVLPAIARRHRLPYIAALPSQTEIKKLLAAYPRIKKSFTDLFDGTYTLLTLRGREVQLAASTPAAAQKGQSDMVKNRILPSEYQLKKCLATRDLINTAYHGVFSAGGQDLVEILEQLQRQRAAAADQPFAAPLLNEAVVRIFACAAFSGASDASIHLTAEAGSVRLKIDGVGLVVAESDNTVMHAILKILVDLFAGENENALNQRPLEALVDFCEKEQELRDNTRPDLYQAVLKAKNLLGAYRFRLQLAKPRPHSDGDLMHCVFRVLKKHAVNTSLRQLGYGQAAPLLEKKLQLPAGLILFAGATGSGKTTAADALLATVDSERRWVSTLENPIEYYHPLFVQYEVRGGSAEYLEIIKSLLRCNPNIVFFGECRESDIAARLAELSLTGSLVVSTLHAADAPTAVQRLREMGIDNSTIAEVLIAISGQCLLPRLCPSCASNPPQREELLARIAALSEPLQRHFAGKSERLRRAAGDGCGECGGRGYRGRWLAYEILEKNRQVHNLIAAGAPADALRACLYRGGDIRSGIAAGAAAGALDIEQALLILEEAA